jgi:hypothetical protein
MSTGKAVQFHGSRDCFQPYFHRCSDLAISPGHARQVTQDCQRTPDALGKGRRSGKIRPMRRTADWSLRAPSFFVSLALCAMLSGCLLPHRAGVGKKETAYNVMLSEYSADLPVGAKRAEVEEYLRRKHVEFGQLWPVDVPTPVGERHTLADLVRVGHNHQGWPFCDGVSIYIAFVFVGASPDSALVNRDPLLKALPSSAPADALKEIKLFSKADNCL